jgi:hypothetical protein
MHTGNKEKETAQALENVMDQEDRPVACPKTVLTVGKSCRLLHTAFHVEMY